MKPEPSIRKTWWGAAEGGARRPAARFAGLRDERLDRFVHGVPAFRRCAFSARSAAGFRLGIGRSAPAASMARLRKRREQ